MYFELQELKYKKMETKFPNKEKLREETLTRQYKDINAMIENRIVKGCYDVHCNYELLPEVLEALKKEGYIVSREESGILGSKVTIISWQ